ncbi:MAG: hypothetical protein ACPGJV_12525 [Bacteriovoracaceae bacterium]
MFLILLKLKKNFLIIAQSLLLSACAGYQFKDSDNPLRQFEIEHLTIPMFVNKSSLPKVGPIFTKDFIHFFSEFSDLKVSAGEKDSSDGILLGIVGSKKSIDETVKQTSLEFTETQLKDSIGSRNQFYVPNSNNVNLQLRVILLKKIDGDKIKKVVFDRVIELNKDFKINLGETTSEDSEGLTNFTENRYNMYQAIELMSESAVDELRDLIINVF